MLEYDWGNPAATVIFAGDEPTHDSDQSRQIFDHYAQAFNETLVNPSHGFGFSHQHFHQPQTTQHHHAQTTTQAHLHSLYDPRAFAASYQPPPSPAMLSLEPIGGVSAGPTGFVVVPKSEPGGGGSVIDFASRIGLNLGGRTYFSSSEDDFVNRLYRRSRPAEPVSVNSPRCQAEGCNADLTHAKHYHRRHKVCEFHSKAATVIAAGLTQRFCQQCSRSPAEITITPFSPPPHSLRRRHSPNHPPTRSNPPFPRDSVPEENLNLIK